MLTYNLMLDGGTASAPAPGSVDAVARCLEAHFTTPPVPPRWLADAPTDPPARLVYLLDHEYTERSLSWSRLKGTDAGRAAVLRAAAARAGCEAVLALADVHETWSCFEPAWERSRYRRSWDDEDNETWPEGGSN